MRKVKVVKDGSLYRVYGPTGIEFSYHHSKEAAMSAGKVIAERQGFSKVEYYNPTSSRNRSNGLSLIIKTRQHRIIYYKAPNGSYLVQSGSGAIHSSHGTKGAASKAAKALSKEMYGTESKAEFVKY